MMPIRFNTIRVFSICTFLLLFQTINSLFIFSLETSEETGSSSDESEESKNIQLLKDVQTLSPNEQRSLMKNFLVHLLTISQLQTDERKLERNILQDLIKIPNFEQDALVTIKKFRKSIDDGRKALDHVIEKRKNASNPQDPEVMKHYENMWQQIEMKKCNEAKSALDTVDSILSGFAKSVKNTVGEQLKTLQGIQEIIGERKKRVDHESKEIREKVKAVKQAVESTTTSTTTPSSISTLFLFDEKDVKRIREIYTIWMEKLPKLEVQHGKDLLRRIEKSGIPLPLFCKSIAEMHVIQEKAEQCNNKGDKTAMDVLLKTLEQPMYKKCEEIITQSPPPSIETIAEVIRRNFFNKP